MVKVVLVLVAYSLRETLADKVVNFSTAIIYRAVPRIGAVPGILST